MKNAMKFVGWLSVALLILLALVFSYLLHPLMGAFMTLVAGGAFWWAFQSKRKVDVVLDEVARQSGLRVTKQALTYNMLRGDFQGFDTEVRVVSSHDAGVGTQLTALTGEAGWSSLDIRNVTSIKMKHDLAVQEEMALSSRIVATPSDITLVLSHIPRDANAILKGMRQLVREIKRLEQSLSNAAAAGEKDTK